MTNLLLNPFAMLIVGMMMGAGLLILFIKRVDHAEQSGCFYALLMGIDIVIGVTFLLGIMSA